MNPCSCSFVSMILKEEYGYQSYKAIIIKKCPNCGIIKIEYNYINQRLNIDEFKESIVFDEKEKEIYNLMFQM